jgi:hypothetical protein
MKESYRENLASRPSLLEVRPIVRRFLHKIQKAT